MRLGSGLREEPVPRRSNAMRWPTDDCERLACPDPQQAGRMPEMLRALGMLRGELGNEVLVVGCVLGPFTLAAQLLGLETTLYLAIDDPQRLERLDGLCHGGSHSLWPGPIPGRSPSAGGFRSVGLPCGHSCGVLPGVRAAAAAAGFPGAWPTAGAMANWLHIAGPVQTILPYYAQAGVQIANFDYCVNVAEARRDCCRPPVWTATSSRLSFVEASPAEIEAEALGSAPRFRDRGGFILSSGCEIPPESRPENVAAMVHAPAHAGVKKWPNLTVIINEICRESVACSRALPCARCWSRRAFRSAPVVGAMGPAASAWWRSKREAFLARRRTECLAPVGRATARNTSSGLSIDRRKTDLRIRLRATAAKSDWRDLMPACCPAPCASPSPRHRRASRLRPGRRLGNHAHQSLSLGSPSWRATAAAWVPIRNPTTAATW